MVSRLKFVGCNPVEFDVVIVVGLPVRALWFLKQYALLSLGPSIIFTHKLPRTNEQVCQQLETLDKL
jgi:hypothetical protein